MGRVNFDRFPGVRLDPAAQNAAAREDERVDAVAIDDGERQVAIKRSVCYGIPRTQFRAYCGAVA